ncbi:hypothetical protein BGW36DRAFT_355358 [Talaromyces proteolyticus]|uniref:FAD-binding PCMH-type domain-containing protein n=1 Tax=Talaromyces proteolyticus TaxID=1131652 RepID=A0AAD4Q568_9EURO|nr:uncharacterized protein BGW36DRAFT_355358 [Talaromyces proteolyticus]KAH8703971.1 hypothetical protein BGW36DRAFT_355358 [Talaromyces proteolyticus]
MDGTASRLLQDLKSRLGPEIRLVTLESPDYQTAISRWSATSIRPAGIVAFPLSTKEVSNLVLFATLHRLCLAVKGGAHSTGGNNSSDGGLIIDFPKIWDVSVDLDNKVIIAHGGCTWEGVNRVTEKYKLSVVSSTISNVGIGGSTPGGGFGWFVDDTGQ